jgi:hypothetical protein
MRLAERVTDVGEMNNAGNNYVVKHEEKVNLEELSLNRSIVFNCIS